MNLAKELNRSLKEIEEVKIYLQLKDQIGKDQQIQDLLDSIAKAQKEMKNNLQSQQMEKYYAKRKELNRKKEILQNHPFIVNYFFYREEVYRLVEQIRMILSEK